MQRHLARYSFSAVLMPKKSWRIISRAHCHFVITWYWQEFCNLVTTISTTNNESCNYLFHVTWNSTAGIHFSTFEHLIKSHVMFKIYSRIVKFDIWTVKWVIIVISSFFLHSLQTVTLIRVKTICSIPKSTSSRNNILTGLTNAYYSNKIICQCCCENSRHIKCQTNAWVSACLRYILRTKGGRVRQWQQQISIKMCVSK